MKWQSGPEARKERAASGDDELEVSLNQRVNESHDTKQSFTFMTLKASSSTSFSAEEVQLDRVLFAPCNYLRDLAILMAVLRTY